MPISFWSSEEQSFLIRHYADEDMDFLSSRLNKSKVAIYGEASRLKLRRKKNGVWSKDDDEVLKDLYPKIGVVGCSQKMKRTIRSIYARAGRLKLRAPVRQQPVPPIIVELTKLRQARKMSFAEIGRISGYDGGAIRRYERGGKMPSRKTLEDWAAVFGKRLGLVDIEEIDVKSNLEFMVRQ